MREIAIQDVAGFKIGQAQDKVAGTGCTVVLCDAGMAAGLDVRGGGPASRESELLRPLAAEKAIHAVVLAGGSAFGLAASDGVMRYLEERGIGFDVGVTKVPLVCQAGLFDLTVADASVRPDATMGYAACEAAQLGNYRDGNFGAGTGATVGKLYGMERCMKSGIGSFALQVGEVQIGAIVAVNALGDVYDHKSGKKVAGLLNEDRTGFCSMTDEMARNMNVVENRFTGNTTLGVVLTNAMFDNTRLCKIAAMAHNGLARSIRPVHTSADGDSIFALSIGTVTADLDAIGTLAVDVVSEAILRAVNAAQSAYGYPAAVDIATGSEAR